ARAALCAGRCARLAAGHGDADGRRARRAADRCGAVMAILFSLDEQPEWAAWLAERPPTVRAAIERWPPNRLYRMDSGHRGTIASYRATPEGIRVMMDVTGEYNLLDFARRVFGIDPATLVECDLPEPGEPLGALLTERDEIEAYIADMRRRDGMH